MNYTTKFKTDLENKFKEKNISQTSINLYLRNLEKLNDDMPLKNLNFLSPVENILNKLKDYKPNTFRGYLISICSALHLETSKKMTKLYNDYYNLLIKTNKDLKEKEKEQEKTPAQKENWITWEEVEKKHKELEEEVNKFKNVKEINQHKYNILLEYVILSLYYYIPPKRNQDWTLMRIVYKDDPSLPTTNNYYDVSNEKFIFNKYKTSKTNGELVESLPEKLKEIIKIYFKFHPLIKDKAIKKDANIPFLVYYNGDDLTSINSITRILNKIFKKKIGSSMLRHIYLTSKYGDTVKEMKEDAQVMGHSIQVQQNNYIKKPDVNL
jgi:integrase